MSAATTQHGHADFPQDRPDHEAHEQVDASPQHAADDMDEIEKPVIVARDCERHHAKREHGITEIVLADKLPGVGIGNCGHRPSDLIFSRFCAYKITYNARQARLTAFPSFAQHITSSKTAVRYP